MRQVRTIWLFLVLLGVPASVWGQATTGSIAGRVTEEATGAPVAGAQVFLSGTTRGIVTNQQGQFLLTNIPAGQHEVAVSLIGFAQASQRVTVTPGQTANANFTLKQSAVELGAVVVTASGQQQRTRELGNSVANIQPGDASMAAVNSVTTLLQSRAPGVSVQQNSGTGGTAARIRIRGSNSVSLSNEPLVIVDGVRVNVGNTDLLSTGGQYANRLDDFSVEQIESIEILKGPAAAALYGTAAANGVIQITTKRGKAGPARWAFYTEHASLKDKTDYPSNVRGSRTFAVGSGPGRSCVIYDLAMARCTEQQLATYTTHNPLESAASPIHDGYRRQTGLSIAGGSDAATYYVSGDMEDETGIFKSSPITGYNPNQIDRVTLRANINARPTDHLDFSVRAGYSTADNSLPVTDNHLLGIHLNSLVGSGDSTINNGLYNNVTFAHLLTNMRQQEVRRFTGSLQGNYRPLDWLTVSGSAGLDQVHRHDQMFYPSNVLTTYTALYRDGYRDSYRVETVNFTTTGSAAANFAIREDLVSTSTLGVQLTREDYHDTRGSGQGMVPGVSSLQGATSLFTASENTVEFATFGAFAQQQFAFRDRVYLTGALRGDDNSAFGDKTGFVMYPSLSASWVISEESFFPAMPVLSSLRLRGAWGKSGLRPGARDAITLYDPVSVRLDGADTRGFTLRGTGSAELRPEVAREIEFGLDAGLFDDRLAFEITHYNKLSKDALVRRTLAPSLGLSSDAWANIGSVSNKGWEGLLRGVLVDRENARFDVTLGATRTRNQLEELADGIPPITLATGRNRQEHRVGYALGGYWQRPIEYADLNGDGLLQYDRTAGVCTTQRTPTAQCEVVMADTALTYLGQPFPTREASLNSSLTLFKLVRVSALLDHKGGFQVRNHMRFDRCSWEQVCEETYVLSKTSLRDQAGWLAYNVIEPSVNTAVYHEDGDFVKLREVAISLEAPASFVERYGYGVSAVRLTLSGRNLKTWTDYRGLDPELNQYGLSNFQSQEYYTQPPVRYYTARFDINF
jgi:TonB-linked SusC/RagA family outer membrane protein